LLSSLNVPEISLYVSYCIYTNTNPQNPYINKFDMDKLCLIITSLISLISLAIFFGVFFGVNYPEIKISKYTPTTCQSSSSTTNIRFCCDIKCSCDTQSHLPKCSTLVPQSQSLSPTTCFQNSTLCPKSGSDALCYNTYFDCYDNKCTYCGKYVFKQTCKMNCTTCYDVKLNVTYDVGQQQKNSTYTQNFRSLDDANKFLVDHKPNDMFRCFYNPSSLTKITLNQNFTPWKWILFAFSAFPLFVCLIVLTYYALYNYIENKAWRWSVISFIWIGLIVPLVILLNVWKYGLVSKEEMKILMIFILIFVTFGSLPVMIKFLINCKFIKSQIIYLSLMGLIIPLTVYVPIILYVPSSKKILFYTLIVQPTLVLLIIISKRIGLKVLVKENIMSL